MCLAAVWVVVEDRGRRRERKGEGRRMTRDSERFLHACLFNVTFRGN